MTLASCAKTIDHRVVARVIEAIDGLDDAVSNLRTPIFDESGTLESNPVAVCDELNGGRW
jgi:hypothetical protein